jgi:ppGpp synthetase/RelA/SpoT-type nucleotidyltranferase
LLKSVVLRNTATLATLGIPPHVPRFQAEMAARSESIWFTADKEGKFSKMGIPDNVITDAVARYDRERDRYLKLAAHVADICRADIVEANAIRAEVTSRGKSVKSFDGKLKRFAKRDDKTCQNVDEVFAQIGDFAGVRVATYRPEDESRVTEEIKKRFRGSDTDAVAVERKDKLEENGFYRATHCQVFLPDEELVGTYENLKGTGCEIQVCSMMAHVWNEIEHDIGYKPEGGGPQPAEKGLLQALGHLTRSGDEIITRLLEATLVRLEEQTGDFEDAYDFVARLRRDFGADFSLYAGQLFDEIQNLGLTSLDKLKNAIGEGGFRPQVAREKLNAFNQYLADQGQQDYALDEESSDLILILLLQKFAERIEANHAASRGMGRPARIRSIAMRFRQYLEQEGQPTPVA